MNTIGKLLKDARLAKRYSLTKMENITRIRRDFIESIEEERWDKLPAFTTILGFAKSLSTALEVDPIMAVAVLKRDYPPKKLFINPKPDVSAKFIWSPKLTFLVGAGIALSLIFGYLIFQYARFISPPKITIMSPKEGEIVSGRSVYVIGLTETDAKILINGQPVIVDDNGKFSVDLGITGDTKEIVVKSISRSGKESTQSRRITVE